MKNHKQTNLSEYTVIFCGLLWLWSAGDFHSENGLGVFMVILLCSALTGALYSFYRFLEGG